LARQSAGARESAGLTGVRKDDRKAGVATAETLRKEPENACNVGKPGTVEGHQAALSRSSGRGRMQTSDIRPRWTARRRPSGLCGPGHREVKAKRWESGLRPEERRGRLRRKAQQAIVAWHDRNLAQAVGGQGVLSHPEGEGLRAYRARGRATPTEAIESSVVISSQRMGARKGETRRCGSR